MGGRINTLRTKQDMFPYLLWKLPGGTWQSLYPLLNFAVNPKLLLKESLYKSNNNNNKHKKAKTPPTSFPPVCLQISFEGLSPKDQRTDLHGNLGTSNEEGTTWAGGRGFIQSKPHYNKWVFSFFWKSSQTPGILPVSFEGQDHIQVECPESEPEVSDFSRSR